MAGLVGKSLVVSHCGENCRVRLWSRETVFIRDEQRGSYHTSPNQGRGRGPTRVKTNVDCSSKQLTTQKTSDRPIAHAHDDKREGMVLATGRTNGGEM